MSPHQTVWPLLLALVLASACTGDPDGAGMEQRAGTPSFEVAQPSSVGAASPAASTVVPSPTDESVDLSDGGELLPESIARLLPARLLGLEQAELDAALGPQQQWPAGHCADGDRCARPTSRPRTAP